MISLDLTRQAPIDTTKLYLVKGKKVSVCYHCHKSVNRPTLLRCTECRHDFCPNCLDSCRCYTQSGFRIGKALQRRPLPAAKAPHLAVVSSAGARL